LTYALVACVGLAIGLLGGAWLHHSQSTAHLSALPLAAIAQATPRPQTSLAARSSDEDDPRLLAVRAFYAAWAKDDATGAYAMLDPAWQATMNLEEFRGMKDGRRVIATYYSIQPRSMSVVGERAVKVTYVVPNADTNFHVATWALHNIAGRWFLQGFHDFLGEPAAYKPELIVGEDADTDLRAVAGMSLASDSRVPTQISGPAVPTEQPRSLPPLATFHGYGCSVDCSGHEAGYNWAEEHDITDRDDCPIDPDNSPSFTEGCYAYADEQSDDDSP
jgi:hypothetical protein